MRISDWSSDVCSSDLIVPQKVGGEGPKCIEPASPRPRLAAASMPLRPLDREVRCERTPMARAVEESGERTKLAGVRPGAKKSQRRTDRKSTRLNSSH